MNTTIREALRGTRLFVPVRNAYFTLFNTQAWAKIRSLKLFYAQFVSPGDLLFDVGANVGGHAEAFASLGARVIAIEPNPECVTLLRKVRGIAVEPFAVGDAPGGDTEHFPLDGTLHDLYRVEGTSHREREPGMAAVDPGSGRDAG